MNNPQILIDSLKRLTEPTGRFDRDPHQHANNTIEDMAADATKALADYEESSKPDFRPALEQRNHVTGCIARTQSRLAKLGKAAGDDFQTIHAELLLWRMADD